METTLVLGNYIVAKAYCTQLKTSCNPTRSILGTCPYKSRLDLTCVVLNLLYYD